MAALAARGRPALTPKALLRRLGLAPATLRALRPLLHGLQRDGLLVREGDRVRLATPGTGERAPLAPRERGAVRGGGRRPPRGARPGEAGAFRVEAEAPRSDWIGLFAVNGRGGRVTPYRDDAQWSLAISPAHRAGAKDGDVVEVERVAGRGRSPAAQVREVLGRPGDPEADFRAIVWRHRLPVAFPAEALAEAEALPDEIPADELAQREDWRVHPLLTIDPANARDHDDAVCVTRRPHGGTCLRVAIADVAHFVPEGSALDAEAFRRGNSVYFPDRAIPMLPRRLSGEIGSLIPQADRLALGVELVLAPAGSVRSARFARVVIRSRARLSYDEAAAVMEGAAGGVGDPEVREQLLGLRVAAEALMRHRFQAGSIDFDLPTAEIVLGDAGHPVDIVEAPRTRAHRAIEEAMLAANRAVASELDAAEVPAIYRVHEPPAPADLEALQALLEGFGLLERSGRDPLGPREIARAVQRVAGRPEERLVNQVALRSMRQARYADANRGHFALAFDSYTHFTSPIRRYADLLVHRALRDRLDGSPEARRRAARRARRVAEVAARASWRERLAMEAEREMIGLKKCAFLKGHLGEEHDGTVTGVAAHGLYVTLDPYFAEGLVHVSRIPGRVELDERAFALVERRTRERWRLGDRLRVRIQAVDLVRGRVDFALRGRLEPGAGGRPQPGGGARAWSSASTSAATRSHSR